MTPTGWPVGTGLIRLDSVDSTNNEANRQFQSGSPLPFWVIARDQTNARGRRGRAWSATTGNFMASYLCRPGKDPADAALRSFTISLALSDALIALGVDAHDIALKWPNDVLYKSGKLAGILLESTNVEGELLLCIGIGVNLVGLPDTAKLDATAMRPASLDGMIKPDELLSALAASFAKWEQVLLSEGFAPIRTAWLSRAAKIGEIITARLPNAEYRGMFETVDDSGALVLKTLQETLHLPAADVFF